MNKISVLGSLNMDLVTETEKVPVMGETVHGKSFKTVCGGKGANQALAIARLGGNVEMLGAVGDDAYGKIMTDNMKSGGAGTEHIKISDTSSGIAAITVSEGDNSIIVVAGANGTVDKAYIDSCKPVFEESDYLVMQLEIPFESVEYAMQMAKACDTKVVFNPAPMNTDSVRLIKYTDIFVVNEHEAAALCGFAVTDEADARLAVKKLLDFGAKTVIITLGEKGAVYNIGEEILHIPAVKAKAVDTTAAGDSFIGASLVRLLETGDLTESLNFAAKVSAIVVSRPGATASIPMRCEIN